MPKLPISLRTGESEQDYQDAKSRNDLNPISEEKTICSYRYWRIIENRFPYDVAYKTCHMLVPKRDFARRSQMTVMENHELYTTIYRDLEASYHQIIENMMSSRSIQSTFHLHLVLFKKDRELMKL